MPAVCHAEARLLPRGRWDALRQVLLFAFAYLLYRLVRGQVNDQIALAFWNASRLIWLEQQLGFFVEPAVQRWAIAQGWVIDVASWLYLNSHFVVSLGALVWLYLRRNESFYFIRNMFMVAMALALVGYFLYPTAPPRLMPEWGFQDSVAAATGVSAEEEKVDAFFNLYAAVPSMHVAFALMIGGSLARLVRSPVVRVLWLLYPVLITFVVVATANHFIMDAVLGAVTAAVAAVAAQRVLAPARPTVWAFQPQPARLN